MSVKKTNLRFNLDKEKFPQIREQICHIPH